MQMRARHAKFFTADRDFIKGGEKLAKQLRALPKEVGGDALVDAVDLAADPVIRRAKSRIPVRQTGGPRKTYKGRVVGPGFARSQIDRKSFKSRNNLFATCLVGVGQEAWYAVEMVELGTVYQAAQPWLRPAFAASRKDALRIIMRDLQFSIEYAVARN